MSDQNRKALMARAIALGVENVQAGGGPFAALVVKDGQVIAEGANRVTSSNDPTAHAEVMAIRAACQALDSFQLTGCDLYTTCEPCPVCLGAIYWARPDRVFYASSHQDAAAAGFDDAFIYDEIGLAPEDRKIPMQQVLSSESAAVFEAWEQQVDRTEY